MNIKKQRIKIKTQQPRKMKQSKLKRTIKRITKLMKMKKKVM